MHNEYLMNNNCHYTSICPKHCKKGNIYSIALTRTYLSSKMYAVTR